MFVDMFFDSMMERWNRGIFGANFWVFRLRGFQWEATCNQHSCECRCANTSAGALKRFAFCLDVNFMVHCKLKLLRQANVLLVHIEALEAEELPPWKHDKEPKNEKLLRKLLWAPSVRLLWTWYELPHLSRSKANNQRLLKSIQTVD